MYLGITKITNVINILSSVSEIFKARKFSSRRFEISFTTELGIKIAFWTMDFLLPCVGQQYRRSAKYEKTIGTKEAPAYVLHRCAVFAHDLARTHIGPEQNEYNTRQLDIAYF